MKIGFIYAGQGSQYVGMGSSLYEHYPQVRGVLDDYSFDFDIKKMCFEGPIEELSKTRNTQPCMVAVAMMATDVLKSAGIIPAYTCGLSLGEYSALYCSGVFSQREGLEVVRFRGQAMEAAVQGLESKMAAVIGMSREDLQAIVEIANQEGVVQIANYNCPGQLVIAGEIKAVEKASELAKEKGARRVLPLNTSGPFHTSLLAPAANALAQKFETVNFQPMQIPVIFNSTAKPLQEGVTVAEMLERQVKSSVYFEDSIRYMIEQGVDTFIEIGPGKVLSGFVKKISKDVTIYQVEDYESLEKTLEGVNGKLWI